MQSDLQIKKITEYEDVKKVRDLLAEEWPIEETVNKHEVIEICKALYDMSGNRMNVYGGFISEELICTCTVIPMPVLRGDMFAQIESVVVKKEYRGQGYGKAIVKHAIQSFEDTAYKIILSCNDSNIAFYEKLGFIRTGNEMRIML